MAVTWVFENHVCMQKKEGLKTLTVSAKKSVTERYLALSRCPRTIDISITCAMITACTLRSCYELTSQLILVGRKPIPDVKELKVLLQFELVDSFDESSVQECLTCSIALRSRLKACRGRVAMTSC